MSHSPPQVCRTQAQGLVAYLSIILRLMIGAIYLPFYAAIAFTTWWLDGRDSLAPWELLAMLAFYWIGEALVGFLIARRAQNRPACVRLLVGHVGPPALGSAGAWGIASGLDLHATLLGTVTGLLFAALVMLHSSLGPEPTEEEQRETARAVSRELVQAMVEHKQERDEKKARKRARNQS